MKQKKRFLGLLLVLTIIGSQISTINVQADTTSNPISRIDLNKAVGKNQWGLNEEFVVDYIIQPRDIPQSLVPEALYHKNGANISLVIDKSGSMNCGIDGNRELKTTTSYAEDPNGTYIRFYNGSVSYYGTYYFISWNRKSYICYNSKYYEIKSDSRGKYVRFNSTKHHLDLQKKYKQQQTIEKSRMKIVSDVAKSFVDKFQSFSNVKIGLVNYSTSAQVMNNLTNNLAFSNIKRNINEDANGATNIGDGLRKAYWQLKDNRNNDKKKFIVLLTDGEPTIYSQYGQYPKYPNVTKNDYITDNRDENYYIDGGRDNDIYGKATAYANTIAGIIGIDNSINSFMIAFSKDATGNKLAGISNIASNNKPGFYKEATSIEDINEVYEKIAQTILSDLSIYGLQLEETFPNGISIVGKSNGLKIDSTNNKIIGDIGNINYTLDEVNHVFKAQPINFWVKLKGTVTGDYVLGKNAKGNSTSFVSYKDINDKNVNPSPSFSPMNINIYNKKPPDMEATFENSVADSNYNLIVKVDKASNIVVRALSDSSVAIASQDNANYVVGTNYTYQISNIPAAIIQNNISSSVYNLSVEATDASNSTLNTKETVPLTSVQLMKSDINTDNILIQTDINTKITEVKLNDNIILSDQVTDSCGKYSCNNVALNDGNNIISVTVGNSYNNTTQTITRINVDKTPPNITLVPSITAYTNNNVTVSANITDASLILDKRYARADKPLTIGYFSSNASNGMRLNGTNFQALENGVYTVYAKDKAGNESVVAITINNIDKISPTGIISGNLTSPVKETMLTLIASDTGGSGVKRIQTPDGGWISGTVAKYNVSQNNTYTFKVEDNAGNTYIEPITINNIDNAIIKTGLFINNKFSEKNIINIVKGFSANLAFEITNLKSNQVTVEVNNAEFIKISDVKVYATTDLRTPINNVTVHVSENTITITNLSNENSNYVFVFKTTALKITSTAISDAIKINGFPRDEKHTINIVKLPPLQ